MDVIVEEFKNSKVLSLYVAMHLERKLRTCLIQFVLEEIGFEMKKFFNFSNFCQRLKDPQKYSVLNYLNFLKNKHRNWLSGTWQLLKGMNSGSLVSLAPPCYNSRQIHCRGGVIMVPPVSNKCTVEAP